MGVKERKEREREQQQQLILNAAAEIIADEGFDKLSIRKLADKIEYSPAIVYHYFKDKDDIVTHLMKSGYKKITDALSSIKISDGTSEERLTKLTRSYIETALNMKDEFKNIQLSSSPEILEYTSSMFSGAVKKKSALAILAEHIKEIYKDKDIDEDEIELTTQIIAASTFGLIIKLIIENVEEIQRNKLINQYIKCTVEGMILRKPINN